MEKALQLVLPLEPRRAAPAKPIRRRVFRLHLDPSADGTYTFRARSFTRRKGRAYRCRVNPATGFVWCNCKDFTFRKAPQNPSYFDGSVCKHLERAMRTVRKLEREVRPMDLPMAA